MVERDLLQSGRLPVDLPAVVANDGRGLRLLEHCPKGLLHDPPEPKPLRFDAAERVGSHNERFGHRRQGLLHRTGSEQPSGCRSDRGDGRIGQDSDCAICVKANLVAVLYQEQRRPHGHEPVHDVIFPGRSAATVNGAAGAAMGDEVPIILDRANENK